jgi:hypothetical protein
VDFEGFGRVGHAWSNSGYWRCRCSTLRQLVVQILRIEFKFGNNYSGRAEYGTRFVVEVLLDLFVKDFARRFGGSSPGKHTKTPSPCINHMTPSVMPFSVSIQWITLIFSLVHSVSHPFPIRMLHRKREPFCYQWSDHKVQLVSFVFCFVVACMFQPIH